MSTDSSFIVVLCHGGLGREASGLEPAKRRGLSSPLGTLGLKFTMFASGKALGPSQLSCGQQA